MHIRIRAKESGVPLWRVAIKLGISEPTMYRWLRVPLKAEQEEKFMNVIDSLSKGAHQCAE